MFAIVAFICGLYNLFACFAEKLVSTIRVTDTLIEDIPGRAIFFRNTDAAKHNVIWIERVAMHNISGKTDSDYSTMRLDLRSAYVLIRNCDISNTDKQALSIHFNSTTSSRVCEATIAQNKIDSVKSGGVIFANNSGVNNAKLWVRRNTFQHNSALDKYHTISIENCTVVMEYNVIYNNTGSAIFFLNDGQNTGLKHQILDNTFWFNSAQKQPSKISVVLQALTVNFHSNILNNPSNNYEITAAVVQGGEYKLDCSNNWWGSGLSGSVNNRIRDGKTVIGVPIISYEPFLENPPKHFGLSSEYLKVYNVM